MAQGSGSSGALLGNPACCLTPPVRLLFAYRQSRIEWPTPQYINRSVHENFNGMYLIKMRGCGEAPGMD